jgi:uncharacterized membrane protein YraQ (UPF0718 family)
METSPKRFTAGSFAVGFAFPLFAGMELIYTWFGMELTFRDVLSELIIACVGGFFFEIAMRLLARSKLNRKLEEWTRTKKFREMAEKKREKAEEKQRQIQQIQDAQQIERMKE